MESAPIDFCIMSSATRVRRWSSCIRLRRTKCFASLHHPNGGKLIYTPVAMIVMWSNCFPSNLLFCRWVFVRRRNSQLSSHSIISRFSILQKGPKLLYLNTCVRGYPKGLRAGSDPRKPILTIDEHFEKIEYRGVSSILFSIEVSVCWPTIQSWNEIVHIPNLWFISLEIRCTDVATSKFVTYNWT